jgi:hypothetical protein
MFRNGTQYEASGRWYDGNLVRWENSRLKPIGGWRALMAAASGGGMAPPLSGTARGGIAFEDNVGNSYLLLGTNTNLYVSTGGVLYDITPTGFASGHTGSIPGPGYGAGPYGADTPPAGTNTYGTRRVGTVTHLTLAASTWSFDTFGNSVVCCCSSDQNIYQFDPTATIGTPPVNLSNPALPTTGPPPTRAPTAQAVMVANEDFILALGAAGNVRRIAWPSVGTSTDWVPTGINTAGGINLNTDGKAIAGARVGAQNLVWTDSDAHLVNYVGPPAVYGTTRIGSHCGLIGPRAYAVTDVAYWMGVGGFFIYNGIVTPMPCEVQDYLWRIIDFSQAAKIYGATNTRFNEIMWFFPSLLSPVGTDGTHECDSYVIFNYKENVWYFGSPSLLARTTWVDRDVYPVPGAVDAFGHIFQHEIDYTDNGASRVGQVRIKSGFNEIANGDKIAYSNLMLPDAGGTSEAVSANISTAFTPEGPVTTQTISMTPNAEGYVPLRLTGRQIAIELVNVADADWSLGKPRLNVVAGGRR